MGYSPEQFTPQVLSADFRHSIPALTGDIAADGITYAIRFSGHGQQVQQIARTIVGPLQSSLDGPLYLHDIAHGIRKTTYPDSWVRRTTEHESSDSWESDLRYDAQVLASYIEGNDDNGVARTRLVVPVHHNLLSAILMAHQELLKTEPLAFKYVANQAGIAVNDLAVHRLRMPHAEYRPVAVQDYLNTLGNDSQQAVQKAKFAELFEPLNIIDVDGRKATVYIERQYLPANYSPQMLVRAWIGREIETDEQTIVPSHTVLLESTSYSPFVYPELRWFKDANTNERHFVFGSTVQFNETLMQVEHSSPLLGAVALAGYERVSYANFIRAFKERAIADGQIAGYMPAFIKVGQAALLGQSSYIEQAERVIEYAVRFE